MTEAITRRSAARIYGSRHRSIGFALAMVAAGCVSTGRPAPDPQAPPLDPLTFFSGHTQGTGVLKIALHRPEPTLVEGYGRVDGDTIVLDQTVRRGSRKPTHRRWRLTRVAPGRYRGTLSDAEGPVVADVRNGRLTIAFRMKGGFDARQWLVLDPGGGKAQNVMLVTKLGIPVARLDETIARE